MSPVLRRAQPWLGTIVSVAVANEPIGGRGAAFSTAFAAIERVHNAMSPQRAASDVARFNTAAGGALLVCDPWTVDVLSIADRLKQASAGLFDVALGSVHGDAYRIVDRRRVLKLADDGRIDLGGIAKGYAVDRAVAGLRARGVKRGLVNAGGDLRAFGPGSWPVRVRGVAAAISLERGALATSQYLRGRSPHHHDALIVPQTGDVLAVDRLITVAAPRCVLADALTKIVALSGDRDHPAVRELDAYAWLQ